MESPHSFQIEISLKFHSNLFQKSMQIVTKGCCMKQTIAISRGREWPKVVSFSAPLRRMDASREGRQQDSLSLAHSLLRP